MQRKWRRDWERMKEEQSGYAKRTSSKIAKYMLPPLMAAGLVFGSMGLSQAAGLPDGGKIAYGSGTINQSGNTLDIHQNSGQLGIDWQGFSIGSGNTVNFYQPGRDSIALNRVVGNEASNIYGHLNANGRVFLINPNGVLFAKGASVDVGSLVASTLNISDADFANSNYTFNSNGGSGKVENNGTITAASGGYVALLGTTVANNGVIVARKGTVALAAGQAMAMSFHGDGLLNLAVSQAAINATVANHSLIQADGGQVIMTAKAANTLAGSVVNNSGMIEARGLENKNGVITLDGGTSGPVTNSGMLDASGKTTGQTGGTVKVLGETVDLDNTSAIDVSGDKGGGTVLVGGNFQGKGPEQNATTTTVAAGAKINADAITSGNGGQVAVWSDDKTTFNGAISAQGGSKSGDGGSVETSGHRLKVGAVATVATQAAKGKTGNWLLDPYDFTIGSKAGDDMTGATLSAALENSDVTIETTNSRNVVTGVPGSIPTTGTSGTGAITVNDPLSWDGSHTLKLWVLAYTRTPKLTYGNMYINAPITATNGGLVLQGGSNSLISCPAAIDVGTFTLSGGNWRQVAADMGGRLPDFSATCFSITSGTFLRALGGDGSSANPYQLTDAYGLQGVGSVGAAYDLRSKSYVLANDIDLAGTKVWNSGQGFNPIGGSNGFSGSFDGAGHTISNLYINYVNTQSITGGTKGLYTVGVGLFTWLNGHQANSDGTLTDGSVRNLHLTNVDITASNLYRGNAWQNMDSRTRIASMLAVGGLAGVINSADVDNVSVTGKITGINVGAVGGLAGLVYEDRAGAGYTGGYTGFGDTSRSGDPSAGIVRNSSSTAAVTATGGNGQIVAGGLIGELDFDNYTKGEDGADVTGFVRNNWSSGTVKVVDNSDNSTVYAGGLVGLNQGMGIDQSYSTGPVTVDTTTNSPTRAANPLTTVYAGGLVGASTDFLATEASYGAYTAADNVYSYNQEKISDSYSSGRVNSSGAQTYVGGFAGANSGVISKSYWLADTSGQSQGVGATTPRHKVVPSDDPNHPGLVVDDTPRTFDLTGLTRAQSVAQLSFKDWDFAKNWFMLDGYTTPFLRSEYTSMYDSNSKSYRIGNSHQLQLMAMDPTAKYTLTADLDLRDYSMAPIVGFVPIDHFTGSFDGQGHTVSYLNIHDYSGGDSVGLFARITGDKAAVHDLALANATVSGTKDNRYVGILDGVNSGSIYDVYTGGKVSGSGSVGGIAGSNAGTLTATFSSAQVTGGTNSTGGLVGDNTGSISDSYLDDAGSVNNSPASSLFGTNTGTVTLPDYHDGRWVNSGGNHYLAWTVAPDGTIGLYTASQLQQLNGNLSGSYRLRADLDLAGRNWTAIGTAADAFTGKLAGGGYGINNLTIAGSALKAVGLFGYTRGAALSNLTLTNVSVAGTADNTYVGGLAGYSEGGRISAGSVGGTVTAAADNGYAGGLAGYSSGAIVGSASAAAISAAGTGSFAGGLAGFNAGSITNSFNTGAVTAKGPGSYAGGVAGSNSGAIGSADAAVYNSGAVTTAGDNSYAGGIAGGNTGSIGVNSNVAGIITPQKDYPGTGQSGSYLLDSLPPEQGIVYNTGAVTARGANSSVGGVAGLNGGKIFQAYNAAIVAAYGRSSNVGGIAGVNNNTGSIESAFCGATGSGDTVRLVSTGQGSNVGGIAGVNSGSMADTMSFVWLNSSGNSSSVGGLVGQNSGSLATSYALGAVQGTADSIVGGLIGSNAAGATVANLIWNPDSAFAPTDDRWKKAVAVGTGSDAGTKALSYAEMLDPVNWAAFTTPCWTKEYGVFPRLNWQPKYTLFGRVQSGGPGLTVNKYDYDYSYGNVLHYTTATFGADGLYFMTSGGTQYNDGSIGNTTLPRAVLFTVGTAADQPYKANAVYVVGMQPTQEVGSTPAYTPVFYDLYRDTLLFSLPEWTSALNSLKTHYNFKDAFDSMKQNPATAIEIANRDDPDLLFTVSPAHIIQGDWHDPGRAYDDVYLYDIDVEGNFVAKNVAWYDRTQDSGVGNYHIIGANITTHKTVDAAGNIIANGDITLDNSQKVYDVGSDLSTSAVDDSQILLSTLDQAMHYNAAGNITINEPCNVVIGAGSGGPRLVAGGDITIHCGGNFRYYDDTAGQTMTRYYDTYFINWAGPGAIQAGGRYLIYAKDMLLSPLDSSELYFKTRYLDPTYNEAGMEAASGSGFQQFCDTSGGLSGSVLWNTAYDPDADPLSAGGSGFIYTRHDPRTAAGIAERFWMTPAYFAAQQRQQRAVDAARTAAVQTGNGTGPAPAAADSGHAPVIVVDGGVALPPAAQK